MFQVDPLDRLVAPQQYRRFEDILQRRARLVHYTSAEAALLILSNRSIWLRNTLFMNDFSEIEYGLELFGEYFHGQHPARAAFWGVVDRTTGGRAKALQELFDGWVPDLSTGTFICSLSEHLNHEDGLGRLSMWRAYGRPNGVALVINPLYLASQNDALGAFSYPIEYCDKPQAQKLFEELERSIVGSEAFLATRTPDEVYNAVFYAFQTLALTIKHPGFAEELEWRVVYRPAPQPSPLLKGKLVSIGGAPQKIFELPLENVPGSGVTAISPAELVDHLIIGPCIHAYAMRHALIEALEDAGVADPAQKVFCSNIPVR